MSEIIRLNIKRQLQTQNQESPYGQVTNLIVDIEEQMDSVIRNMFKNSDTFAGHVLAKAKLDIVWALRNAAESICRGESNEND